MKEWLSVRYLYWIFAAIVTVFLFYGIFSSSTGIKGYLNKKNQLMLLNQNIESIRQENEKLYDYIKQFKNDPRCRMKVIRDKLGWIQEGERRITFVPQESGRTQ